MTADPSSGRWNLGLDLGGTACRAVALRADGEVAATAIDRTPTALDPSGAVAFVHDLATALGMGSEPAAIGIGASGPIDVGGTIRNPDTLPAFTGLPLLADLSAAFGVPVHIDNDAVTAALAEQRFGAGAGSASLLHVTLGTGVGVAMLTPSGPFRGGDGVHPEAGHLTIAGPTRRCYCGRDSCFEQGASRSALQAASAALLSRPQDDPDAIAEAAAAAAAGDVAARAVFAAFGLRLADGLSSLIGIFHPDLVVLGGSATRAHPAFAESLDAGLAAVDGPHPRIALTQLDDHGGAIGAALLVG